MSAPRPHSSACTTCDNPDYLALLLCALHDLRRRLPLPQAAVGSTLPDDKPLKSHAPVLDSLARILLSEERQEVVAVAFKPVRDFVEEPPSFILAQNENVSSKVHDHLRSLLDHLRKIHNIYKDIRRSQSPPDLNGVPAGSENEEALLVAKLKGELDVLYHSRRKVERRFTKNSRYKSFLNLVADVRGLPADQREDFDENDEARRRLKVLQTLSTAHRDTLLRVGTMIEGIRDIFVPERRWSDESQPTAVDLRVLVDLRVSSHIVANKLLQSESSYIWRMCDNYLRAWPRLRQHGDVTEVPFDVGKWLGKVISVSRDFVHIVNVAESPTMGAVLFSGPLPEVKVVHVANSMPPPVTLTISKHAMKSTLQEAGWTDVGDETYAEYVDLLFGNLLSRLKSSSVPSDASPGEENPVTGTLRSPVHCECALLAHLHDSGAIDSVIPYIGLSKPPCELCSIYFESYRAATLSDISIQATRGQLVGWRTPSLSRDISFSTTVDTDVRKRLCETLMEKLRRATADTRVSIHRKTMSQSTVASGPKYMQFQADVDDVVALRQNLVARLEEAITKR